MTILRAIVGLIIVGLLCSTVFFKYQATMRANQIEIAQIKNGELLASNSRLHETITKMTDFRTADQKTFAKLVDNQAHILTQSAVTTAAIVKLRANNVEVDKYLNEPVPLALRELLNSLCQQGTANCPDGNDHSKAASDTNHKLRH